MTLGAPRRSDFDRLVDLGRRDVILAFDFRRYQRDIIDFVRQGSATGANVVLFTDRWQSPAAEVASVVLISPVDRSVPLAEVLAQAPAGASVGLGRLSVDDGRVGGARDHRGVAVPEAGRPEPPPPGYHAGVATAAAMARRAWDLDALAADLRAHLPTLHAALDAPVDHAGPGALRRIVHLTNAVFVDLLRDPGLPRELRPPDWPGDELRSLIGRVVVADGPAAVAHIAHRCDTAA